MPTALYRSAIHRSAIPALVLGLFVSSGLIVPEANADPLQITVTTFSDGTGPYFNEVKEEFERLHPETTVQIDEVSWAFVLEKLNTDVLTGDTPDLAIIGTRWLVDFVRTRVATPLDDFMDDAFRNRFIDVFLSPSRLQGKTYGLPIAASARAMYYNKDLFKQAEIDSPPDTWQELSRVSKRISALGDDIAGFGLQGNDIESDIYFYYAFWAFGGKLVEDDGTSGLDSEAAYKAAELYRSLIDSHATQAGVAAYSREDVQNLFKRGKVGMMITSPILANQIKNEVPELQYGVTAIPAGPDGDRGTYGVTDSIIMFENSRAKESAWEFLDLLFTTPWREKFNEVEGFLPVNKEVASSPAFAEDEILKAFTALLPEARFAPIIPRWEEIANLTSDTVQRIYLGDADIKASLNATAARINEILNR